MPTESNNPVDLGACLHDGILEALRSDLMGRTLSFVINSPFHWEFHNLPADTRFELIAEGVRTIGAYAFEPWPGAVEPTREMPWKEAQAQRRSDALKGRLISSDWNYFASQIGTEEEYTVMSADLTTEGAYAVLRLGAISYPGSNFRDVEIRADVFQFLVGKQELSLDELKRFGDAYWDDWSKRFPAEK